MTIAQTDTQTTLRARDAASRVRVVCWLVGSTYGFNVKWSNLDPLDVIQLLGNFGRDGRRVQKEFEDLLQRVRCHRYRITLYVELDRMCGNVQVTPRPDRLLCLPPPNCDKILAVAISYPLSPKVVDGELDKAGRLIREAIWIRKTDNMNRDEGSYQLSHVWDKLLHTDDRHRKLVLMKASDVKPKC